MSVEFLLTAFVVVIAPGTGVLYTLAVGLARGGGMSVVAALGCTLGILPYLTAAVLGLAALLHASAVAFEAVKYAGVAYLLYMAWSVLRQRGALAVEQDRAPVGPMRVAGTGILINLLNPKLSIFFLAFLPQFVPAGAEDSLARMIGLSLVFMALTFVVFVSYGICAAAVRRQVIGRPAVMAWLRRGFAAAFLALGVKLALTSR